jgi:CRP-like cAMP-binding protein
MTLQLLDHIRKYVKLSDAEFGKFSHFFDHIQLSRKQLLLEAGDTCDHIYFVGRGCLNMYFVNEKEVMQTAQLAIENWWLSDFLAFTKGSQTDFFIEAVEETQLLSLSRTNLQKVSVLFPPFETYLRTIYQIAYGASIIRLKSLHGFSKAQRYQRFIEKYPEFAQRVPQYLLASFLGLTPEYVSELRSKMRS